MSLPAVGLDLGPPPSVMKSTLDTEQAGSNDLDAVLAEALERGVIRAVEILSGREMSLRPSLPNSSAFAERQLELSTKGARFWAVIAPKEASVSRNGW